MFRSSNFFSISYISCVRHTFGLELRFLCYYHHGTNKLGSNRLTNTSFFLIENPFAYFSVHFGAHDSVDLQNPTLFTSSLPEHPSLVS